MEIADDWVMMRGFESVRVRPIANDNGSTSVTLAINFKGRFARTILLDDSMRRSLTKYLGDIDDGKGV